MATSHATGAEITSPNRSHWIALDWMSRSGDGGPGFGPVREEMHPICEAPWRGKRYRVEMETNRYLHSSGWSEWRIWARRGIELNADGTEPDYLSRREATDKARAALGDVCRPLVVDWLASPAYTESRRAELARGIVREIKDAAGSTYNLDRAEKALARAHDELEPAQSEELRHLIELARELAEAIESAGA